MNLTAKTRLIGAFPPQIREDVGKALVAIPSRTAFRMGGAGVSSHGIGPVFLGGNRLHIPARVYTLEPEAGEMGRLTPTQRLIVSCVYTRHHDGRVREKYLAQILRSRVFFTAVFVVALLGEYVIEIIQRMQADLGELRQPHFRGFVRQNPEFMALTRARVTSYWDCYYRRGSRGFARADYPGFRVLEVLEALAG